VRLLPRTYPLVTHAPEEILHSPGSRRKKAPPAGPQEPTGSDVITAVTSPASSGPPSPGVGQDKHQQGTTIGSAGVSSRRKSGGFSVWASENSSNSSSNSSSSSSSNNSNSNNSGGGSSRVVVGEEAARLAPRHPSQQQSPHPAVMKNLMEPHQNQGRFDKLKGLQRDVVYLC
jgi:hypothetical protein